MLLTITTITKTTLAALLARATLLVYIIGMYPTDIWSWKICLYDTAKVRFCAAHIVKVDFISTTL